MDGHNLTVIVIGEWSIKRNAEKMSVMFVTHNGFRSVVVITSALHAEGPGFEPQRNQ